MENREVVLIAHDIRSAHNVGAFLRTADGAGVTRVYLTGYTLAPSSKKYLLTAAEKQIKKTALGAEDTVLWEKRADIFALLTELKQAGFGLYALEQDAGSIPYDAVFTDAKVALVVGNEVEGVPSEILARCDAILEIPMSGSKNSLNVSVATGIALYELTKNQNYGSQKIKTKGSHQTS
jgi:tRNA G18 (ribose-2'-O)-methylase SpoU